MKMPHKFISLASLALLLLLLSGGDHCPKTYQIPMRDGVTKLATDVYTPGGSGKFPVILARTPYDKNSMKSSGTALTDQGYVAVFQDIRGRYASAQNGQQFHFFQDDSWGTNQDGYDTVAWILAQPWCDGHIGMMGGSAVGITQTMLVGSEPAALQAIMPLAATGNLYRDTIYPGGVYRKELVDGWLTAIEETDLIPELISQNTYSAWWDTLNLANRYANTHTAGYHLGGWYDIFTQGTIDDFVGMQKEGGEGALGNQKLVMGPYTHGTFFQNVQGELVFPENAKAWTDQNFTVQWYDQWLKGIDSGIMQEPAVYYYVMGDVDDPSAPGNEWRTSDTWPIDASYVPLYFHKNGSLGTNMPFGEENSTFTYDPDNPVPTTCGDNLTLPSGPCDQRPIETRSDVVLFETVALTKPIEVTGRVTAHLFVGSDAPDTDFTVKLTDVYPDGRSMLISDGIIRMRYRDGFDQEVPMAPNKFYYASVDLWSTSIVFNVGHKIRVAVSSSNDPKFDPNPNTGAPLRSGTEKRLANQVISHQPFISSFILLPVVQTEAE
jgi:predicted acyl esterase